MKDSQHSKKKKSKLSRSHFFDIIIILLILNAAAFALVVLYFERIDSFTFSNYQKEKLKVSSVPLPSDLNSINASAAAFVVFDTKTRSVIAQKNKDLRFAPASTVKVMSALLALSYYDPYEFLVIPDSIYEVEGSKMKLVPGEEIRVIDLLYGMMLPSGNDAAYTLAYYYKNGVEDFVRDMNLKAKEYKLENTEFKDPAGYNDENYTTGEDLVRLGAIALENEILAQIVKTKYYETSNKTNTHYFYLENLNELLYYDNVLGIKTGFTYEAGGVLLTAIKKGDSVFIVCVLKSYDRFYDTRDLMEFITEKVNFALPEAKPHL